MTAKALKLKASKRAALRVKSAAALPVEDDERHLHETDEFIIRNREALNASIRRSRKEVAEGKFSRKTIDDILSDGRRRHVRNT